MSENVPSDRHVDESIPAFTQKMKGQDMTLVQILTAVAGGTALLAACALVFLPREVSVVRSGLVSASPEAIVALAASNDGYQRFNPYRTSDPDLKIELFGPAQGVGSGFRFEGKDGRGQQTVAAVTDSSVHYAIDLGPMGQPVQALHVAPQNGTTRVTWEMQADLGLNPVARVFGLFMDRMIGPTFEQGLSNLNDALSNG
jgi:hypothetical protein